MERPDAGTQGVKATIASRVNRKVQWSRAALPTSDKPEEVAAQVPPAGRDRPRQGKAPCAEPDTEVKQTKFEISHVINILFINMKAFISKLALHLDAPKGGRTATWREPQAEQPCI